MPLLDKVKANLVEWYSMAADRTEEMAKIGLRRYDKFGISRDIERQFAELGNLVYTAHNEGRSDFTGDATFAAIMARIKELENELARKESEIESIRQEARTRKAAAGSSEADAERPETGAESGEPDRLLKDPPLERGRADSAILLGREQDPSGGPTGPSDQSGAGADASETEGDARDLQDDNDPKKD
jgi:hypothetical protein